MSWIEILLAFAGNVQVAAGIAVVLSLAGTFACIFAKAVEDLEWRQIAPILRVTLPVLVISTLLSVTPTIDQVWRVRIGLIKLQLASPENIQKGADVIERLGKKLECKYLGCTEGQNK